MEIYSRENWQDSKVRDRKDAIASTRDARASQT
jgi:hypothetical protein